MMMTPLAEGDVNWVFPHMESPDGVQEELQQASARIEALAAHLGVRAGWKGGGLEFAHLEGGAEAYLFGFAEKSEVSFIAELHRARVDRQESGSAPGWVLDARVLVTCDQVDDCGGHMIEQRTASFDRPLEAAGGLAAAASWLLERGIAEPLQSWNDQDEPGNHRPSAIL